MPRRSALRCCRLVAHHRPFGVTQSSADGSLRLLSHRRLCIRDNQRSAAGSPHCAEAVLDALPHRRMHLRFGPVSAPAARVRRPPALANSQVTYIRPALEPHRALCLTTIFDAGDGQDPYQADRHGEQIQGRVMVAGSDCELQRRDGQADGLGPDVRAIDERPHPGLVVGSDRLLTWAGDYGRDRLSTEFFLLALAVGRALSQPVDLGIAAAMICAEIAARTTARPDRYCRL